MENVREFVCNLRTLSHEHDCLANISTKEAFMLLLGKGNMLTRSNQRQKYMKKTLLLWILAVSVIIRYGPHLMTDDICDPK